MNPVVHLQTLGHPALRRTDGTVVPGLRRKKDLALLVYLCVEGTSVHTRGRLATLLWGESPEKRARHSLTQALRRVGRVLPGGALATDKDAVYWHDALACDAVALLRDAVRPGEVDDAFSLYAGPFLEGFHPGPGAEDFEGWAERRRAELRGAALRLLERAGGEAAAAGEWSRALRLALREVEIEPVWEQGHRRVMRAMAARGERNRALQHYQGFEEWLEREIGGEPDPETRALAEQIRALDAPAAGAQPPDEVPGHPAPAPHGVPRDPPVVPGAAVEPAPVALTGPGRRPGRVRKIAAGGGALLTVVLLGFWILAVAESGTGEAPPAHGEHVRLRGGAQVYLAFADTLWAYPDSVTLDACTGSHPHVARELRELPPWPRRGLPSVRLHPWMRGRVPVVSDHPSDRTAYTVAGCIRAGVPTPATLDSIFGEGALERMTEVVDSVLRRVPRASVARGHPLRRAGTLIRAPDGALRWIVWHGGALAVDDPRALADHCHTPEEAVPVSAREFDYYRPFGTLSRSRAKCRAK